MESDKSISAPLDGHNEGIQRIRPLHGRTTGPARRSTKGQWTAEEDEILRKAVQRFKGKNWKKIAECFKDRTDVQCLHRWQKVLNPELVKGPWSKEEDEIIIELVNKYGPKKWSTIAQHLPGRIGKQCRERWHNHLNPSINKEAWTQQEELALIRAHQIYGNRWAELTKFLPGRTDNAIKNHWNSSVKKKLDSYLASGLLEQFQDLPLVVHQSQPMPLSYSRVQSSGDDTGPKFGMEAEEISECSQESTVAGCSQSTSGLGIAVLHGREEFQLYEESVFGKEQSSSPASCSDHFFTSVRDVSFSIPEVSLEVSCSSNFLQQNFSHTIKSASGDYQYSLQELPSIELGQESSGLSTHCIAANKSYHKVHQFQTSTGLEELPKVSSIELGLESSELPTHCIDANERYHEVNPIQTSMGLEDPSSIGHIIETSSKPDCALISEDECCQYFFNSEELNGGIFSPGDFDKEPNSVARMDSINCQPSTIQSSESDKTSHSYSPSESGGLVTSCSQSFPSRPSLCSGDDSAVACSREENQLVGLSFTAHEQEFIISAHEGFIYTSCATISPCDGTGISDMQEQHYLKEPSKLVPVNSFASDAETAYSCPVDELPTTQIKEDTGSLFYEPPRFPSLDIPFLSCDLVQSGSDMQQEYSPLGIRQLMMSSSMNCITPFRLWDSPSHDDSPDVVLKSAAKTFTGTPSILKKRSRDLLSPLSDRRHDKKLEVDLTSSLTKEFSKLDVVIDDSEMNRSSLLSPCRKKNNLLSIEDKENLDPSLEGGEQKGRISDKDGHRSNSLDCIKQGTGDGDATTQTVEQPSGVLVEDRMNDFLFFSPDQVGCKTDRAFAPSSRTPKNLYRIILGTLSEKATTETISRNSCININSPANCKKSHSIATASGHCVAASASLDGTVDDNLYDASTETNSTCVDDNPSVFRFGGTPFRRSIESPSAWKSPWFINSFLPGPRVDTDISIEDICYFMSPGDRSYDAVALMKQLSEQNASAYADALEVLGNETPETLLEKSHSNCQIADQDNNNASDEHRHENDSRLNVLTECRTLDFSECGTPGEKGMEGAKSSTAMSSFSSPNSYLLKSCR